MYCKQIILEKINKVHVHSNVFLFEPFIKLSSAFSCSFPHFCLSYFIYSCPSRSLSLFLHTFSLYVQNLFLLKVTKVAFAC